MKLAICTAVAVLFSAGYAFAGGGAPVPQGSQSGEPSGRPSAVLDDAACQNIWKMASPEGDALAGDKAAPYIVNFQMVDTDKDGKVSAAEFKTGCGKGWIQSADASTTKEMTPAAKL
jgi:EF hand domain-containing protein